MNLFSNSFIPPSLRRVCLQSFLKDHFLSFSSYPFSPIWGSLRRLPRYTYLLCVLLDLSCAIYYNRVPHHLSIDNFLFEKFIYDLNKRYYFSQRIVSCFIVTTKEPFSSFFSKTCQCGDTRRRTSSN